MSASFVVAVLAVTAALVTAPSLGAAQTVNHPGVNNCSLRWESQALDHFGWRTDTYQQRWFVYDKWFKPGGPVWFYVGNEANVELFANWTGLMWDHGSEFNALLVFAEHRFFGKSQPCPGGFRQCGDYLSTDQAMADYATLIGRIRTTYYPTSGAVITFGGSYGGMLSAWMRMRYPLLVQGAIASSAPIGCLNATYDGESYWRVVTHDATPAGGSVAGCDAAIRSTLGLALQMLKSPSTAQAVVQAFRLCGVPPTPDDLGYFIQAQFDSMAMGSYSFSTYYIAGTVCHPAPPFPMRKACGLMMPRAATVAGQLDQLYRSISVIANLSAVPCYNTSDVGKSVTSPAWDFMVCTSALFNEIPYFAANGKSDMFWQQPKYDRKRMDQHCRKAWGKTPRWDHFQHDLSVASIPFSSNIVFANGALDPWHSGGILNNVSSSIVAYMIPDAGHHLDLFFADPTDGPGVRWVRRRQLEHIRRWMTSPPQHAPRR